MAETEKIAQMAEILSNDLFSEFLWNRTGTTNHNWPCENPEVHGNKTHPSDVVFYYDEPYSQSRTYINCDLKSYAKGTIKATTIKDAIVSLASKFHALKKVLNGVSYTFMIMLHLKFADYFLYIIMMENTIKIFLIFFQASKSRI
ncbi:hypothetical protein [Acinetobacter radioresistens]|uniref:hypothetical protein n=1 Tax=Acinetobacter radioresistens TaxID=40216 RepID=UPI001C092A63|nr:hypothetical protein [Acinetobacter radioresistens]